MNEPLSEKIEDAMASLACAATFFRNNVPKKAEELRDAIREEIKEKMKEAKRELLHEQIIWYNEVDNLFRG